MESGNSLFCFGYGYSCDYLGYMLQQSENWSITGTTRDTEKKAFMQKRGIKAFLFDYRDPLNDPRLFLKDTTHLLISAPPGDQGDPAFLAHAEDILQIPSIRWVGYLSSTSVYGDRNGAWVDETSELRPGSKRGSRRAMAEKQWQSLYHSHGLPVHIFRLAGIYGPGRSAIDSVRAGIARRIEKPGHAFNRIHVEDIVQVLIASMHKPNPGSIYNISDDNAAASHEVISHACHLLDISSPTLIPFDEADMAPMARSFYAENKRIHNNKIKEELGVRLKYPDYISGIQACLEAEQHAIAVQNQIVGDY